MEVVESKKKKTGGVVHLALVISQRDAARLDSARRYLHLGTRAAFVRMAVFGKLDQLDQQLKAVSGAVGSAAAGPGAGRRRVRVRLARES